MPTRSTRRKNRVEVQIAVPRRGLPSVAAFRRWAAGFSGITLRIVGRKEGLFLNRTYRGKSKATNVLTFDTGDVVLCDPVIRKEAKQQGKSLHAHYAHLVVHGALHFHGHDHLKNKDAARMERAEVRALRRLGFANPYG